MEFKEWIFIEDKITNHGDCDTFYNESDFLSTGFHLYPTYAYDWNRATDSAKQIKLVKDRWHQEEKDNRLKFINIDMDDFNKIPFVSVNSRTIPDTKEGFWKHKEDNSKEGAVKIEVGPDLHTYGVSSIADKELSLEKSQKTSHPFGDQSIEPPNYKLKSIFKDNPSEHGPEIDEKSMDSPFLKKYESYLTEYGGGGGAATSGMHGGIQDIPGGNINNNMPVNSRISANIKTKEKKMGDEEGEKTPEEIFGFKKWLDKKRSKERRLSNIDKNKKGAPLRVPVVYT